MSPLLEEKRWNSCYFTQNVAKTVFYVCNFSTPLLPSTAVQRAKIWASLPA